MLFFSGELSQHVLLPFCLVKHLNLCWDSLRILIWSAPGCTISACDWSAITTKDSLRTWRRGSILWGERGYILMINKVAFLSFVWRAQCNTNSSSTCPYLLSPSNVSNLTHREHFCGSVSRCLCCSVEGELHDTVRHHVTWTDGHHQFRLLWTTSYSSAEVMISRPSAKITSA